MRPLVRKWRGEGRKCILYLDDGIFGDRGYSRVKRIAEAVKTDLLNAGLTIKATKSNFVPTQKGMFLAFILDTTQMLFSVPTPKLEKLMQSMRTVNERTNAIPKEISRIAGQIISMGIAIGPLTRLFTRHIYAFIESRNSWFEHKTVRAPIPSLPAGTQRVWHKAPPLDDKSYLFGRQRKRIWRVLCAAVGPGHRTRTIFTLGKGNQFHSPRTFRRPLRLAKLEPLSP